MSIFRIVGVAVAVFANAMPALSKDLSFSIQAAPQTIELGKHVTFTFVYKNLSHRDIGIIPEYYTYEALDVHLKSQDTGEVGQMIPFLSPHIDPASLAKRDFHLLRPGEEYTRQLTATFSRTLPKFVRGKPNGTLYLVFNDSAISIPKFGKFEVTSRYLGIGTYREYLAGRDARALWVGKIFAPQITMDFRSSSQH